MGSPLDLRIGLLLLALLVLSNALAPSGLLHSGHHVVNSACAGEWWVLLRFWLRYPMGRAAAELRSRPRTRLQAFGAPNSCFETSPPTPVGMMDTLVTGSTRAWTPAHDSGGSA